LKVVAHPDPFVLESELVQRISAVKKDDPLAPVLVLVPTARLAAHVRRLLARQTGVCLAVDVLHHRALVLETLERGMASGPKLASTRLLEAILREVIGRRQANLFSRYMSRRPGTVGRLLASLRDLREAMVPVATVQEALAAGPERDRALSDLHAALHEAMEEQRERGLVDETGLVEAALPLLEDAAGRWRAIIHHGAYELIGVHVELIRALDRRTPLTFLLPAEPGAPAFDTAERFARRHLLGSGESITRLESEGHSCGLLGERLGSLLDEDAVHEPLLPPDAVRFHHAQGSQNEVRAAVGRVLAAVEAGTPPDGIALVARDLTSRDAPYGALLEQALDDLEVPWTSSAGHPMGRVPAVADLLRVLEAVADDFPRAATAELFSSPRLRWERLISTGTLPTGDRVEDWSRRAGILGGFTEWTETLPAWAAEIRTLGDVENGESPPAGDTTEAAGALATVIRQLRDLLEPETGRTWCRWVDKIREILAALLPDLPLDGIEPISRPLLGLLEEMKRLDDLRGTASPVSFREAVDWLRDAVDGVEVHPHGDDRGGFRVLDAMQARGMTFRRIYLLGFHAGSFPRLPSEDPFLSDASRREIRRLSGRPLAVSAEGDAEEHQLLAMLLGSASDSVEVFWQRADESGRTRSPSLLLREVGRVVLGCPELARVQEAAHRLPAHPKALLESLAFPRGLLSPEEAAVLTALACPGTEAVITALGGERPDLLPGLEMLAATESLAPTAMAYDGRVGPAAGRPHPSSSTALELLGTCPLKYFFRRVLKIREPDEEATPLEIHGLEMGSGIHRVMERLYSTLAGEGLFESEELDRRVSRAVDLLPDLWRETFGSTLSRRSARLPVLWRSEAERWLAELDRFVREDLLRMAQHDRRPAALEAARDVELDLGAGVTAPIHGRLDRLLEGAAPPVVGDYKTGRRLEKQTDITEMLRGHRMQAPLYRLLAGQDAEVEFLSLRPVRQADPEAGDEQRATSFSGFENAGQEAGFLETLRVLLDLSARGSYPLRTDGHCRYCAYRLGCRRNHPPTLEREEHAPDDAAFRHLQAKNKSKRPMLADVQAERSDPAPGDPA
jgi:ATP-dependent helicase/nuclease subunit B